GSEARDPELFLGRLFQGRWPSGIEGDQRWPAGIFQGPRRPARWHANRGLEKLSPLALSECCGPQLVREVCQRGLLISRQDVDGWERNPAAVEALCASDGPQPWRGAGPGLRAEVFPASGQGPRPRDGSQSARGAEGRPANPAVDGA